MDVSYLQLISPLPSSGIELILFGYVNGFNRRFYPLYHVSLRAYVYEFLGIINLMSSPTIFTSAHIAIFLLSFHIFFTRAHIATLLLLLLFSGTPYYWFPYCIKFYTWSALEIFGKILNLKNQHICYVTKVENFRKEINRR